MVKENIKTLIKNVWIVDDNEMDQYYVEYCVLNTNNTANVKKFESPTVALHYIHQLPEVIILDHDMPGMNGFEFCKYIESMIPRDETKVYIRSSQEYHKLENTYKDFSFVKKIIIKNSSNDKPASYYNIIN